jgi:hypothetical protein
MIATAGHTSASMRVTIDSSPRCTNPNTRRAYASVLDRLADTVGADRLLTEVDGQELSRDRRRCDGGKGP